MHQFDLYTVNCKLRARQCGVGMYKAIFPNGQTSVAKQISIGNQDESKILIKLKSEKGIQKLRNLSVREKHLTGYSTCIFGLNAL